jgi:hypothetical protein
VLRNTNFRPRFFDPAAKRPGYLDLRRTNCGTPRPVLPSAAGANVKAVQQMLGHRYRATMAEAADQDGVTQIGRYEACEVRA